MSLNKRNDILKLIGAISMIIDHIGFMFLPQFFFLRIIGRLAIPVFSEQLVIGFEKTSNFKRYAKRLLLFALIAQVPYYLALGVYVLNVLFSLLTALFCLHFLKKKQYLFFILVFALPFFLPMDGDFLVPGLAIIFYVLKDRKALVWLSYLVLLFVYYFINQVELAFYLIIGLTFVLYFPKEKIQILLPKYFFYIFYPGHLLLLLLVKIFLLFFK